MSGNGFFDLSEKLKNPRRAAAGQPPPPSDKRLSVSQVTKLIDQAIRAGVPTSVAVQGEISNFNLNRGSGHAYFTLKDPDACLNCVMFRSEFERLKFMPQHGMELLALGGIRVFASQGRYQLYVTDLQPLGRGALELAFQQLRAKLEAEGLFEHERKKPLPKYPIHLAIVTSRQTAALQDILKVITRFPWVRATLFHVAVQGEGCGPQIAAAIDAVNRQGKNELILLSRGGGSLEDRWGFNHESVARAIAASSLPVITGIGHEVDVSIADLVADHHAHTPTEAAQVAMHWWRNVNDLLGAITLRLNRQIRGILQEANHRLNAVERHEIFRRPTDRIDDLRMLLDDRQRSLRMGIHDLLRARFDRIQSLSDRLQRQAPAAQLQRSFDRLEQMQRALLAAMNNRVRSGFNQLEQDTARLAEHHPRNRIALLRSQVSADDSRLTRAMQTHLHRQSDRLTAMSNHLHALSPQRVLERGYTVTRIKKTNAIVRSSKQLAERDHIITRFHDGEVESTVEDPQQPKLFE
jgi:exodeoxyribonuclease VII large subunit